MHGALAVALLALGLGTVALGDSTPLPAQLASLSSTLRSAKLDVGEWQEARPSRCGHEHATAACKLIKRSSLNLLSVQHAKRSYDVELWAIPQSSGAAAKRLLVALEEDDEFGGTFGKAPESHFRCQNTVLATVGTYRGPRPHTKVDKVVQAWVSAHCGPKPE